MPDDNFRLCYVKGNIAWFTSDIEKQWGDSWGDIPYESKAGPPYDHEGGARLIRYYFEGPFDEPCKGFRDSPYSVEKINQGAAPWLQSASWLRIIVTIMGGATPSEFLTKIRLVGHGGTACLIPEPVPAQAVEYTHSSELLTVDTLSLQGEE